MPDEIRRPLRRSGLLRTPRVTPGPRLLIGLLASALLLLASSSAAEIYKYVDRDGNTHFSDSVGSIPAQYRDQVRDITDELTDMTGFRVVSSDPGQAAKSGPAAESEATAFFDLGAELSGEEVAEKLADLFGPGLIVGILLLLPVCFLISAMILKLSCKILQEDPPGFGRACVVLIAQGFAGGAVGALTNGIGAAMEFDDGLGTATLIFTGISMLLSWVVGAAVLSSMLSYGMGRALLIGIVHSCLVAVLVAGPVFGVIAFVWLQA